MEIKVVKGGKWFLNNIIKTINVLRGPKRMSTSVKDVIFHH